MSNIMNGKSLRGASLFAVWLAAIALTACTVTGTGSGIIAPGNVPVTFAWQSKDGGSTGTMSARLPDGRAYAGPFLQVKSTARIDDISPFWVGWRPGWTDWLWGPPGPDFITVYSGRVIANLQGPDGQYLRCRFQLNDPASGMSGGGQGQCNLSDGRTIDAVFPRS
ncbi:MAG: hypothetical protein ACXWKQ_06575 [Reyranella sp.]